MKEVIGRYLPIPSVPVQNASAKGDYGKVNLTFVGSIFDLRDFIAQERLSVKKNESKVNPRFILIASKFQQLVETQSCGTLKLEARLLGCLQEFALQLSGLMYLHHKCYA